MILVSSCSCLCPIHWSQVLSWEWRYNWSSADRRCSNYIWVIHNFIAYQGASYIRDFTVPVFSMKFLRILVISNPLCWPDDVIQHDRQNPEKSHSTLRDNKCIWYMLINDIWFQHFYLSCCLQYNISIRNSFSLTYHQCNMENYTT